MQVKIDLTRTIGFISGIIPGLRYNDLHLLRFMCVRYRQTGCRIAGITHRISGRDILFHCRIDDLLSVFIAVKVGKLIRPSVRFQQNAGLSGAHPVRIQRYYRIRRAYSVLIIAVAPNLGDCYHRLPGCVAVGHIISADSL